MRSGKRRTNGRGGAGALPASALRIKDEERQQGSWK